MIKKVIVISILMTFVVGGAILYISTKNSSTVSTTLSERSKAYLSEQQKNDTSDFKYARIEEGEDKAGAYVGKRVDVGDCFSFIMVFRVTNPREESSCNWYFGIEKPRGFMTVYMRKMDGISSVEEVDGVSMRKQFPDRYTEQRTSIKGVEYLIYTTKDPQKYEISAFAYIPQKASGLVLNLIAQTPETYDAQFQAMLETIEVR